jgi:hypothetical protein
MAREPKKPEPDIPARPDEKPQPGPFGPRTPYPVNEPPDSIPGAEPDYIPPTPNDPPGRM